MSNKQTDAAKDSATSSLDRKLFRVQHGIWATAGLCAETPLDSLCVTLAHVALGVSPPFIGFYALRVCGLFHLPRSKESKRQIRAFTSSSSSTYARDMS